MGTTTGWNSRKEVIRYLVSSLGEPNLKTLAHCTRGNVLWMVRQWEGVEPHLIGFVLVGPVQDRRGFYSCGYRGFCESEFPRFYSCPTKYLSMTYERCPEWRALVRKHAANRPSTTTQEY